MFCLSNCISPIRDEQPLTLDFKDQFKTSLRNCNKKDISETDPVSEFLNTKIFIRLFLKYKYLI